MDTILRGSIAGFFATLLYVLSDWLLYMLGITPFTVVHYGSVLITPPATEMTTFSFFIGLIAVTIAGTFVGSILSFIIRNTGMDYFYLKSLGFLFVLWIIHVSILPRVIAPELFRVLPLVTVIVNLTIKIIWAITYTYVYLVISKHTLKRLRLV